MGLVTVSRITQCKQNDQLIDHAGRGPYHFLQIKFCRHKALLIVRRHLFAGDMAISTPPAANRRGSFLNFFHRLGAARYVLTALAVALVALGGTALAGVVKSDGNPPTEAAADIAAARPSDTPTAQPTTATTPTTKPTSTPTVVETATATKRSAPRVKPTATKRERSVTTTRKTVTKKERSAPVEKRTAAKPERAAAAPAPKSVTDGTITRTEVLTRARTWITNPSISYDMNGRAGDPNGVSYRSDCSGYASMALHLDAPGRSTIDLPDVTHVLDDKDDLKPGDLLGIMGPGTGGAGGHVMIFVKWNDDSHTSFTVYEHSGNPDRPHKSVYDWPMQDSRGAYLPYRYDKIVDGS